jgi:predicted nucleotide-binding protein
VATKPNTINGKPPDAEAEQVKEQVKKQTRPSSLFAQHRLEDAIKVAEAIENANAGQPYPPTDVAIALGRSPGSSAFQVMLSSSLKYGLTTGSYKSDKIALTPLAQQITAPTSADERRRALVTAALTPTTFRRAFDYYKGKKLPDTQYLMNTFTREFGIPADHAETCTEVFRANLHYVGLLRQAKTGPWVSGDLDALTQETVDHQIEDGDEIEDAGSSDAEVSDVLTAPPITPQVSPEQPKRPQAIFIGHGPNKTPLTQLTAILDEYALPYRVAEYEPNAGRPIPQKVGDLMNECGAAILIFTADRELRDLDGNPVWLSSGNVSHELGAAAWAYDNRVVIFKEQGVDLPSNFSGIGYIEFEKDRLDAHAVELFRELVHFRLVKISVGE